MSNSSKFWLGIFTFLPFILFIVYLILFFTLFIESISHLEQNHHDEFPIKFIRDIFIVFIPIIVAGVISLIVTIYYIVHANNNIRNDTAKKIMWTVILIFVNGFGSLVYYFVEILPSTNKLKEAD